MSYGTITIGRLSLRETFAVTEGGGDSRTVSIVGQESSPPLSRPNLIARHDNLLAVQGTVQPVTFSDKPERNGFYTVSTVSADYVEYSGEVVRSDWKLNLERIGTQGETDIQSRLTGAIRDNDFGLTGERWHAPPIGHYGYYSGATNPGVLTRSSADGTITVYRGLPASTSPRWGCDPADYVSGRVKALSGDVELVGIDHECDPADFELSNGLVNLTLAASGTHTFDIKAYRGGAWHSKGWDVSHGGTVVASWDSLSVLYNEPEMVTFRFTKGLSPGRLTLDVTLRRGSRFIEGYLQRNTSSTLAMSLAVLENTTAPASSGYVVATSDDADGNKYAAGSAHNFSAHASGGVSLASTTTLDFFVGVVAGGSSAVSGDAATDLRNQYIAAMPELIVGVRR